MVGLSDSRVDGWIALNEGVEVSLHSREQTLLSWVLLTNGMSYSTYFSCFAIYCDRVDRNWLAIIETLPAREVDEGVFVLSALYPACSPLKCALTDSPSRFRT